MFNYVKVGVLVATLCFLSAKAEDCGANEFWCYDDEGNVTCRDSSEGPCPVECEDGWNHCRDQWSEWCNHPEYDCPPECNWEEGEVLCYDDNTHTEFCHAGYCPVNCVEGEVECHDTWGGWCQPDDMSCPIVCGEDEHKCWDMNSKHGGEEASCVPNGEPCPCPEDHVPCLTLEGEFEYWWCHQGAVCPKECDWSTETLCWNEDTGGDCVPHGTTCPVVCHDDEHVCESEWGDFCYPVDHACPATCEDHEYVCHGEDDDGTFYEYCIPVEETCPGMCPEGEHPCTTQMDGGFLHECYPDFMACPPTCTEGEIDCGYWDENEGVDVRFCHPGSVCPVHCGSFEHECHDEWGAWCQHQDDACPVHCAENEHTCGHEINQPYCSSEPCPLFCFDNEHACHSSTGESWCYPLDMQCPVECGPEEHHCWIVNHAQPGDGHEECFPNTAQCPLQCESGDHVCHHHEDGSQFCYPDNEPCPGAGVGAFGEDECAEGEHFCQIDDGNGGFNDVCLPKEAPCPIQCPDEMVTCTMPPYGDDPAWSTCYFGSCPITCTEDEAYCWRPTGTQDELGYDQWEEYCYPGDMPCPVICSGSEVLCSGHFGDFCAWQSCPVSCNWDLEKTCWTDGVELCIPNEAHCPVNCQEGERECQDGSGYSYCVQSQYPCPMYCSESEQYCYDHASGVEYCISLDSECPVSCPDQAIVCQDAHGEYCHWGVECPPTCAESEMHCEDQNGHVWCQHWDTPCPAICSEGYQVCVTPTWTDASGYEYPATEWCHPEHEPCPVQCNWGHEHICWDEATGSNYCQSNDLQCPLDCGEGYKACNEDVGQGSCEPVDHDCPVVCGDHQQYCYDYANHVHFCQDVATACPIHCGEHEVVCTTNECYEDFGCHAYSYCMDNVHGCPDHTQCDDASYFCEAVGACIPHNEPCHDHSIDLSDEDQMYQALADEMDTNFNGELEESEFVHFWEVNNAQLSRHYQRKSGEHWFARSDKDDNGVLSPNEFRKLFRKMFASEKVREAMEHFAAYDFDHDDRLNLAELSAFVSEQFLPAKFPEIAGEDGFLDFDEWADNVFGDL